MRRVIPSRWIPSLLAGMIGLTVISCAGVPLIGGSSKIAVHVKADPDCNSCGRTTGNPLHLRIVQIKGPFTAAGSTLESLWDSEEKLLKDALLVKTDGVVDPNQSKTIKVERHPEATTVVVIGNYCSTSGNCWYLERRLEGAGGASIKLRLGSSCLSPLP